MSRRKIAVVALGGALAVSALAGCSSSSSGSSHTGAQGGQSSQSSNDAGSMAPAAFIQQIAQKAGQINSLHAVMTMDGTAAGQPMKMHANAAMQLHPSLAANMTFDQMSVGRPDISGMKEIIVDNTLFMSMPQLTQRTGKPWVKMSLSNLPNGTNLNQLLQQAQQADPSSQIKQLTASNDIRQVGSETVDGVKTTHFAGTLTPDEMISRVPPAMQDQVRQSYQLLGLSSTQMDVWADANSLPVRIKAAMTTSGGPINMQVDYSGYNKPVTVAAPPADEVGDMPGQTSGT
jgi:hypothetical protein